MPDPIVQEIRTDFDAAGVEAAIASTQEMGEATERAAQRGTQTAAADRTQRAALQELVAEQQRHAAAVAAGEPIDQAAEQAARQRERAIDALAAEIRQSTDRQAEAREATEALLAGDGAAARAAARRGDEVGRLEADIRQLAAEETRHQERVRLGLRVSEQDEQATQERRQEADRLERQLRDLADQERRNAGSTGQLADAKRGATGAANGMGVSVGGLVSRLGGLGGALTVGGALFAGLRAFRAELEGIRQLQDDAFREQVTLASAQRSLRLNLVGSSDEEVAATVAGADAIAGRRGTDQAQTTLAVADAISARGGNREEALALVDLAAQIRPDRPEELGNIAGAVGDVQSSIDTDSPLEALGFLQTVGALSRVADAGQQFRSIPQAVTGITAAGFSPAEAGALFSAQTIGSADTQGNSSVTASILFAEQVRAFFAELQRPETGGAAIRALQQDDALGEQFIESLTGEAAQLAPLRDLVRGGNAQADRFDQFAGAIGGADLSSQAQASLDLLASGVVEGVARLERELSAARGRLLSADSESGLGGVLRDGVVPLLEASGETGLAATLNGLTQEALTLGGTARQIDQAVGLIESRISERLRTIGRNANVAGPFAPATLTPRVPSTEDREVAATLAEVVTRLRDIQPVFDAAAAEASAPAPAAPAANPRTVAQNASETPRSADLQTRLAQQLDPRDPARVRFEEEQQIRSGDDAALNGFLGAALARVGDGQGGTTADGGPILRAALEGPADSAPASAAPVNIDIEGGTTRALAETNRRLEEIAALLLQGQQQGPPARRRGRGPDGSGADFLALTRVPGLIGDGR